MRDDYCVICKKEYDPWAEDHEIVQEYEFASDYTVEYCSWSGRSVETRGGPDISAEDMAYVKQSLGVVE